MKSDYNERKEARIEKYLALASGNKTEAERLMRVADREASAIPFGQPILVGHHSEGRDRRYREGIHRKMTASIEADKRAEYYEALARSAESNQAISSDDPEALQKLNTKLAALRAHQDRMKAVNAAIRQAMRKDGDEAKNKFLREVLGVTEAGAVKLLTPGVFGGFGIPAFQLQNNLGRIAQVKKRIEALERIEATPDRELVLGEVRIVCRASENRVQILFPDKPTDIIRDRLKANGFHWSPRETAWQRNYSDTAVFFAKSIVNDYNEITNQTNQLP